MTEQQRRDWVERHIVNVSDDPTDLDNFDTADQPGYFVKLPGDVYYFVPDDVKATAAQALINSLRDNYPRQTILSAFQSAEQTDANELGTLLKNETQAEALDMLANRPGDEPNEDMREKAGEVPPRSWRVPVKKSKFAVLICFEGVNSELAVRYAIQMLQRGNDISLLQYDAIAKKFNSTVCCVEIHDCQKHPLKG